MKTRYYKLWSLGDTIRLDYQYEVGKGRSKAYFDKWHELPAAIKKVKLAESTRWILDPEPYYGIGLGTRTPKWAGFLDTWTQTYLDKKSDRERRDHYVTLPWPCGGGEDVAQLKAEWEEDYE